VSDAQVAPQPASYIARPEDVHRVVLLYSGGLDTSVMLKWIQDEYGAEVIALCVDLGQPADDFDAVLGKARNLGALEAGRLADVVAVRGDPLADIDSLADAAHIRLVIKDGRVAHDFRGRATVAQSSSGSSPSAAS